METRPFGARHAKGYNAWVLQSSKQMMERIRGGGDRRERARALGGSDRDVRSMFHDYDTIEDAMYATQVTQVIGVY
eukprot:1375060-Amorphochlora_amoeboformis.AAC.2